MMSVTLLCLLLPSQAVGQSGLPSVETVTVLRDEHWTITEVPAFEPEPIGPPKLSPRFKPAVDGAVVEVFRDPRNYAGSVVKEHGPRGIPLTAPEAFVVEDGELRQLGYGNVKFWGERGEFVLEVPVDGNGNPSGYEFTTDIVVRLLSSRGEQKVKNYKFLGASRYGAVILGSTQSLVKEDLAEFFSTVPDATRLLRWSEGFMGHWELPSGWAATAVAPSGWVLARRAETRTLTQADVAGKTPEQLFDQGSDWRREALLWEFAWFEDGALKPIKFVRPEGTDAYVWTRDVQFPSDGSFEFLVQDHMDLRSFRLTKF